MRIMVFLHGTTIMHPGGVGRSRAERVEQVRSGSDPKLRDYAAYVPVDDAVAKVRRWFEQGAEIVYLCSHRDPDDVEKDRAVLEQHDFPPGPIVARRGAETYGDVAAREMPDVLIEDDCESLDGDAEVTYPQIPPPAAADITSIVVPEFGGIGHLPDRIDALQAFRG